jgi:hypothetical protein
MVEVPLVQVDYSVIIINNLARITLRQTYSNPLDDSVELHFAFPIDTDFCFSKLKANFEGYTTEGIIMEKDTAKKQYKA